MNYKEFLQKVRERKNSPTVYPTINTFEEFKKVFVVDDTENRQQQLYEIYNKFSEEEKKSFFVKYNCIKNNVEDYNKSETDDESNLYNCDICKNKKFNKIIQIVFNGTEYFFDDLQVPCKCQKIRKSRQIMKENGLLEIIEEKTFNNFKTPQEFQKLMRTKAVEFTKNILDGKKYSFFVGGQCGAGKTHICSAILNILLKYGICSHFFNYVDDITLLNSYQYSNDKEEKQEFEDKMNLYKNADVLYFDDFMYCDVSKSEQRLLFKLINYRYTKHLVNIISSEKTLWDIKEINPSIYRRIFEETNRGIYVINISPDSQKNYSENPA